MLPLPQKVAFLVFAVIAGIPGVLGFRRVWLRIRRGRPDTEPRSDHFLRRLWYAIATTITQRRSFRRRPWVSLFHSLIVYGFLFYLAVNLVDALEGYLPFSIRSSHAAGAIYNLCADLLSFLVMLGVVALVLRRFVLPARHDFDFNRSTLVDEKIRRGGMSRDSILVSAFILVHVGSRAAGAAAKLRLDGPDRFQPLASLLARLIPAAYAQRIAELGYWGALGSVLAFLSYFPWSKHLHIFAAPLKYFFARDASSGTLPLVELNADTENQQIGAERLEDLAWPRLLDAYACIQCNRCQDACPATATGKALSPSALEINKRMELNRLGGSDAGGASPRALLSFALSPEALWACTTCGACLEVCPVQDEPMLDILDIRRNQVMMKGVFPPQLQTAFRGMERASNPWGIGREQRMAWAEGLDVKTVEENPGFEVLYWVGCAASYDPQAQRTARAFVQLLSRAKVNFAVLGKCESCTGDSARRAGNEYLYNQLAKENISTLSRANPRLIVATCPHCMNAIGKEYRQHGGEYTVMHHTEYLDRLTAEGKLPVASVSATVTYHDPCYLGRHNGVYDAPRNLLRVLTDDFVEIERTRENSFCCGAGGAQFWKKREERIADNRFREAQRSLATGSAAKVLAVGCPFCKSMLGSASAKGGAQQEIEIKDVAEILLQGIEEKEERESAGKIESSKAEPASGRSGLFGEASPHAQAEPVATEGEARQELEGGDAEVPAPASASDKSSAPSSALAPISAPETSLSAEPVPGASPERRKWQPKSPAPAKAEEPAQELPSPPRKPWKPKS